MNTDKKKNRKKKKAMTNKTDSDPIGTNRPISYYSFFSSLTLVLSFFYPCSFVCIRGSI